jgi:hypothetical protein
MLHFLTKSAGQGSRRWIGDDRAQALLDLASGRIHGTIVHGGERTYGVTVFVSLLRALYLKRVTGARIVSLIPFPRCAVSMSDQKSFEGAKLMVEQGTDIFADD